MSITKKKKDLISNKISEEKERALVSPCLTSALLLSVLEPDSFDGHAKELLELVAVVLAIAAKRPDGGEVKNVSDSVHHVIVLLDIVLILEIVLAGDVVVAEEVVVHEGREVIRLDALAHVSKRVLLLPKEKLRLAPAVLDGQLVRFHLFTSTLAGNPFPNRQVNYNLPDEKDKP